MTNFYRVHNDRQALNLAGTSESFSENFIKSTLEKLEIQIITLSKEQIVFDLIGVDASIANALRRIILAEVCTMAIETVYIETNTSIIQDEVLSHRLGLIPINADPNKFEEYSEEDGPTDLNTIVFKLEAFCQEDPSKTDEENTMTVYSKHFEWVPQGNQSSKFPLGIAPVDEDIIIAYLRPGQRISLEAHCRKGIGKDHTKYSPVATASYRLLPQIHFPQKITGKLAEELRDICPLQVFDIEDIGGVKTAIAARPRDCTMCRECIRRDGWSDRVHLKRIADHFIFTVESVGSIPPEIIVKEAIQVLRNKALKFKNLVNESI